MGQNQVVYYYLPRSLPRSAIIDIFMQLIVTWMLTLVCVVLSYLATSSTQKLEYVRCLCTVAVVAMVTTIRVCKNATRNATLIVS